MPKTNLSLPEVEHLIKVLLSDHAKALIQIITLNPKVDPRQIISEHTVDVVSALNLSLKKKDKESSEDLIAAVKKTGDKLSSEDADALLERYSKLNKTEDGITKKSNITKSKD